MSREQVIGRNQGRVLTVMWAMAPRPVDARILAVIANPEGDLTQGRRVLAALETRGFTVRKVAAPGSRNMTVRYGLTEAGINALLIWLQTWRPRWMGE